MESNIIFTYTPKPSKSRAFMDTHHVQIYTVETGASTTACLVVSLQDSTVLTLVLDHFAISGEIWSIHISPQPANWGTCHRNLTPSVKSSTISKLLAQHSKPLTAFFPSPASTPNLLFSHLTLTSSTWNYFLVHKYIIFFHGSGSLKILFFYPWALFSLRISR